MSNVITVGKRLIPREHIALVEPFEPKEGGQFQFSRDYKGRVVLLNRDSVLIEQTPEVFAQENAFKYLELDQVATNPAIHFKVETFQPADDFNPAKPYATRLLWRDFDGNDQSKLLLTDPEVVLNVVVADASSRPAAANPNAQPRKSSRRRGRNGKSLALHP
jgi:hypothetical protein